MGHTVVGVYGSQKREIAKLEKSQIKFDEDSQRHYLLIAEGGQGKTENATRQVVIHPKLIEWGFMDYVDRQWKERIFSEVSGTNMTKIGKVLADVRDQLGIPYLDDYGQRRLVHSFRHTMISTCLAGWVGNWRTCNRWSVMRRAAQGSLGGIFIRSHYLRFAM